LGVNGKLIGVNGNGFEKACQSSRPATTLPAHNPGQGVIRIESAMAGQIAFVDSDDAGRVQARDIYVRMQGNLSADVQ